MAVKIETITINDKQFTRTYSDSGYLIERNGIRYEEAIDALETAGRTYTETDIPIEDTEATIEDYQEALKELGVEV